MDFGITAGDTDKTIYVRLRDSTTGLAKTGLTFESTGAVCSYVLPGAARAAITLATQTVTGAHADGGFVEVDATNCKGLYRLDLPDAAIASGAYSLISIEFDDVIEETIIVPLSLRKSDVAAISGDSTAADNLEAAADGTGYNLGGGSVVAASVTAGVGLADDAITAAKYDQSTAFPATSSDGSHLTEAGGTGDHLTAVPWNTAWDAEVQSEVTDALNAYDPPTNAEMEARTLAAASYATAAAQTTAQNDLDLLTGTDGVTLATSQPNYAPAKAGDAMALTSGERTTLAGVVWAALTSGLTTVGSIGKLLVDRIDATISSRGTADPGDEMDLVDAPNATAVTAIQDGLASSSALATVDSNVDAILEDTGATLPGTLATIAGYIDTEIAAVKAKTDNLPDDPAGVSDIPTVSDIWTTALTEAYRATGAAGTAAEYLHEIIAHLGNSSISGTTKTLTQLDKETTAKTFTLDSDTAPTAVEEAS